MRVITQPLEWVKKQSSLLLLLPFLHLCVCFLYLATYFYLAQKHLSIFSNPSDVFSVSFTDIAPFYLSMLLVLVNFPKFEKLDEIERKGCFITAADYLLLGFALYIAATILVEYNRSGYLYFPSLWLVTFIAFMIVPDLLPRHLIKGRRDFIFFFGWFLISVTYTAGFQAQRDLYHSYRELVNDFPSCGGNIIVNKFGDDYLVVRKDNSRWLADRACKLGAQIGGPSRHPYPESWHLDWWPFFARH